MEQLFTVDTNSHIMYVTEEDRLVRVINNVRIGENGTTTFEKAIEADRKTPLGLYDLGLAFGTHDMDIKYPYVKIDDNSYWVDDYKSKHYNYFVEIDGNVDTFGYNYVENLKDKDFSSAEHLIDYKMQYEYAVFIEFNVNGQIDENGVGNNKGSAIFLHCHGLKDYTGGCVAVSKEDMAWIMKFLDKSKTPKIFIK